MSMSGKEGQRGPEARPNAPVCKICRGGMAFVTTIARTTQNPAVEIYRCPDCERVACVEQPQSGGG
jgi:hypothetical protein